MSKSFLGNMPVDLPLEITPGVTHREADFFAQNSRSRGFGVQLDGSTPIGAAKGNRSINSLPARRALTGPGPFGTLKGGR